jgi:CDP-diacylglycerol--glycerol-3-phosphate 3-phosphatidyltransferase
LEIGREPLNIAIRITIFRLFLVPVFLGVLLVYRGTEPGGAEWLRYTALGVFLAASVSDVIDGYIARTRGMITRLGGFLDPLADKLLFGLGIIVLSLPPVKDGFPFNTPPLWYPIAVVLTNLALAVGALSAHVLRKQVEIKAVPLGKVAAVLQAVIVGWILLRLPGLLFLCYPGAVLSVAAGIVYIAGAVRQVRATKATEP